MSRTIYPKHFAQKVTLFSNIKSKNDADGASSVLIQFLIAQQIDLSADATAVSAAQMHETNHLSLSKESGNFTQLCNLQFAPVFQHCKGFAQFLKAFYTPNFKALGNWGIAITDGGKVVYPKKMEDRIALFNNIQTQHNSYPAGTSPLAPYLAQNHIDLAVDAGNAAAAQNFHGEYLSTEKTAENETQQRDILFAPVIRHVRTIGSFLKKLFGENSKALGDWGFVVDTSPRKPRLQKSTVKTGAKKVCKSVIVGGRFTNVGMSDLYLSPGKKVLPDPVIVHPGEQIIIAKGFSTMTVVNASLLVVGKFTVERSK